VVGGRRKTFWKKKRRNKNRNFSLTILVFLKKMKQKRMEKKKRLACVIVIEAVMDGRWMMIRYALDSRKKKKEEEELRCFSEELYGQQQQRDRPSLNSYLQAGPFKPDLFFFFFLFLSFYYYYYEYFFLEKI
jgi:hypothetical protein